MNSTNSPENASFESASQPTTGIKKVTEAARRTASDIKSAASATTNKAVEGVQKAVADKRSQAADRVQAYGSAIHDSARSLEEQDPNIAWFTHQAADRLQTIATYVRERDFQGLRVDAENLARRHPVAFFGGMCIAGLILGNVVKATRRLSTDTQSEYAPDFTSQPEQDYAPPQNIDQTAGAQI